MAARWRTAASYYVRLQGAFCSVAGGCGTVLLVVSRVQGEYCALCMRVRCTMYARMRWLMARHALSVVWLPRASLSRHAPRRVSRLAGGGCAVTVRRRLHQLRSHGHLQARRAYAGGRRTRCLSCCRRRTTAAPASARAPVPSITVHCGCAGTCHRSHLVPLPTTTTDLIKLQRRLVQQIFP